MNALMLAVEEERAGRAAIERRLRRGERLETFSTEGERSAYLAGRAYRVDHGPVPPLAPDVWGCPGPFAYMLGLYVSDEMARFAWQLGWEDAHLS